MNEFNITMLITLIAIGFCFWGIGRGIFQLATNQKLTTIMPTWLSIGIILFWISSIIINGAGIFGGIVIVLLCIMTLQLLPSIKMKKVCSVELNRAAVFVSIGITSLVLIAIVI